MKPGQPKQEQHIKPGIVQYAKLTIFTVQNVETLLVTAGAVISVTQILSNT